MSHQARPKPHVDSPLPRLSMQAAHLRQTSATIEGATATTTTTTGKGASAETASPISTVALAESVSSDFSIPAPDSRRTENGSQETERAAPRLLVLEGLDPLCSSTDDILQANSPACVPFDNLTEPAISTQSHTAESLPCAASSVEAVVVSPTTAVATSFQLWDCFADLRGETCTDDTHSLEDSESLVDAGDSYLDSVRHALDFSAALGDASPTALAAGLESSNFLSSGPHFTSTGVDSVAGDATRDESVFADSKHGADSAASRKPITDDGGTLVPVSLSLATHLTCAESTATTYSALDEPVQIPSASPRISMHSPDTSPSPLPTLTDERPCRLIAQDLPYSADGTETLVLATAAPGGQQLRQVTETAAHDNSPEPSSATSLSDLPALSPLPLSPSAIEDPRATSLLKGGARGSNVMVLSPAAEPAPNVAPGTASVSVAQAWATPDAAHAARAPVVESLLSVSLSSSPSSFPLTNESHSADPHSSIVNPSPSSISESSSSLSVNSKDVLNVGLSGHHASSDSRLCSIVEEGSGLVLSADRSSGQPPPLRSISNSIYVRFFEDVNEE